MSKIPTYMAHVLMGIRSHEGHVTHEMAMDAGDPNLEGMPYSEGAEEVWEDHPVVLEGDHEKAIEQVRHEERERIAQHFEEHDRGVAGGSVVANIIRSMSKESEND